MSSTFKIFSVFAILFLTSQSIIAQDIQIDTIKGPSNKPWYLSFGLDLKFKSLAGFRKLDYEGEYVEYTYYRQDYNWKWIHREESNKKMMANTWFINPKLDVLLSRNRSLQYGISYNMGYMERKYLVSGYDSIFQEPYSYNQTEEYVYLAISAMMAYEYHFNKVVQKSPFVYSSLALGFYRGSNNIAGPGKELFGQIRLGGGYQNKTDWKWRAYVSFDRLHYMFNQESPVFKRPQHTKIDLGVAYFGFGVVKEFTLIPD